MIYPENPTLIESSPLSAELPISTKNLPEQSVSDDAADEDFPLSEKSQKEIEEYAKNFMKAAREFTLRKVPLWNLIRWLYDDEISRQDWEDYQSGGTNTSQSRKPFDKSLLEIGNKAWRSKYIHSPSYAVDTWADNAYQIVFQGSDWLTVIPENPFGSVEDTQISTADKLREFLIYRLEQGKVHTKVYELFHHCCLYGSVMLKFSWYTKENRQYAWDLDTLEQVSPQPSTVDIPVIQLVPLDKCLPDWRANSSDVQMWRGIGNWVRRSYEEIDQDIRDGKYTLNTDEFYKRFTPKTGPEASEENFEGLTEDDDAAGLEGDIETSLRVWEWHGRAPTTEDGLIECVVTVVTDDTDDPTDGIMIRLIDGHILDIGLRPYACGHFTPRPGPFGKGLVENNLPILHLISQFIGQLQDNIRIVANSGYIVEEGSDAEKKIHDAGERFHPGMIYIKKKTSPNDPIKALDTPKFPAREVESVIQYLSSLLDRRFSTPDVYQGITDHKKTAREAHILQTQAQTPAQTRVDILARNVLNPMCVISLGMLQQFVLEDQFITIKGQGGILVPMVITADEIQSGKYDVKLTLTRQDQQEVAKAQSIERVFGLLPNVLQLLNMKGYDVDVGELFKRWVTLIGVDGADRLVFKIPVAPPVDDGGMMIPADQQTGGPQQIPQNGPVNGNGMTPTGLTKLPPEITAGENGGPLGGTDDLNVILQQLQLLGSEDQPIQY